MRTARCPYCDSPSVVDRPATPDRPDPVFAIGFDVDEPTARSIIRRHIAGRRLAPTALKRRALDNIRGVYLPTYLYSAVATSNFDATIGEDYTVVTVRDKKVKRETRTELRRLQGRHTCYVSDVVVSASKTITNAEVEAVEPFDLRALRRYSPALISGWISEEPALERDRCLELARTESRSALKDELRRFMPGDSVRDLRHTTEHSDESADLALLPLWVAAIRERDDADPIRLLVNGQTGRAYGKIPVSWRKIAFLIAAVGAVIGLLTLILGWIG